MKTKRTYSKQVPQRTCVACRKTGDKLTLVRLVRTDNGTIEVDITSRMNGRGAYICPLQNCWQGAVKEGQLERALKVRLDRENRQSLIQYGNSLETRE